MSKPTPQQREFSLSMSSRQWSVLATLATGGRFYVSAAERSDPELGPWSARNSPSAAAPRPASMRFGLGRRPTPVRLFLESISVRELDVRVRRLHLIGDF